MFTERQPRSVLMTHSSLDRLLPVPEVPAGYLLRTWRDGDELGIPPLLGEAFGVNRASFKDLQRFWLDHPGIVPEGIFIIETDKGELVGTATGRIDLDQSHQGYVHRVAVRRGHRRRGLATLLVLKALHYIADNNGRVAIVGTDENKPQAISIYLRLGFELSVESQNKY